jgi:hypothetical protein
MLKKRWWEKMVARRTVLLLLLTFSALLLVGCLTVINHVGCTIWVDFPDSFNCKPVQIADGRNATCLFPGPGTYYWSATSSGCCGPGSGRVSVPGVMTLRCGGTTEAIQLELRTP